jgi:hypothetical protein
MAQNSTGAAQPPHQMCGRGPQLRKNVEGYRHALRRWGDLVREPFQMVYVHSTAAQVVTGKGRCKGTCQRSPAPMLDLHKYAFARKSPALRSKTS